MPAPRAILAAAVEGTQVDFDTALRIEARYFVELVTGQVAKNMIKAFFFDLQADQRRRLAPGRLSPKYTAKKVGVLGAGMMGAGIAYVVRAEAGIEVVLKDVTLEAAEKGKAYSESLIDKAVGARQDHRRRSRDALLARITPTADAADLAGADLVIEAVFENVGAQARGVPARSRTSSTPDALLGSNTSTLPITALAEGVKRPEDFIGLHFFSPVDKMPLVEIISGEKTSDEALARAFDYAQQIKKTPIVVNDSRGFFTSRVIGTFINEAHRACSPRASPPPTIEQAGLAGRLPGGAAAAGRRAEPTLMQKIRKETDAAAVEAEGGVRRQHPADAVIDKMVESSAARASSAGAGFYDYDDGKRDRAVAGTARELRRAEPRRSRSQDIDGAHAVHRGDRDRQVPRRGRADARVADANIGSIFGIGFPAWTGGVLQYINGYTGGLAGFVARAQRAGGQVRRAFPPAGVAGGQGREGGDILMGLTAGTRLHPTLDRVHGGSRHPTRVSPSCT